ncbi:MAG: hypothetical protein COC01_06615 [Bacteroidetes bacterium]|nr:MAG: hypothetical protein COC01_06615 [Bacteroidota bacterium]
MENVTILIYQDSPSRILKADGKSNHKGRFKYLMDLDTDYTVEVSMNGYSTKRIKIFTQMVEKEYLNEDYDITLPIGLVRSPIDKIAEKKHQYAGIIIWDENTYNFNYDVERYQLFQEEQDRLIQMAEVKAELDRQKKEQEAIAEAGRLRKEAEQKIAEEQARKEAEAQTEIERLRIEAEVREKQLEDEHQIVATAKSKKEVEVTEQLIGIVKKAEAMSNSIRIKQEAQGAMDSVKIMKDVEAKEEKMRLIRQAQMDASNNFISGKTFKLPGSENKEILEKMKTEAMERIRKERIASQAEYRSAMVSILERAQKNAEAFLESKKVKSEYTTKLVEKLIEAKKANLSIAQKKKAEVWKQKGAFQKIADIKPELAEYTDEGYFSTTKYTYIIYPKKQDTLQKVIPFFGGDEYYMNSNPIDEVTYQFELNRHN